MAWWRRPDGCPFGTCLLLACARSHTCRESKAVGMVARMRPDRREPMPVGRKKPVPGSLASDRSTGDAADGEHTTDRWYIACRVVQVAEEERQEEGILRAESA